MHARYALWKNPEDLSTHQQAKLAWIAQCDPKLYRGYLLKEGLRHVFKVKGEAGKEALDRWLIWAARCRIPSSEEPFFGTLSWRSCVRQSRERTSIEGGSRGAVIRRRAVTSSSGWSPEVRRSRPMAGSSVSIGKSEPATTRTPASMSRSHR